MANDRSFKKPGTRLAELQEAWPDRLQDSRVLFDGEQFGSAIASGLYALEILLKVLICKRLDLDALPKAFEIHDLDQLVVLTGLSRQIDAVVEEPSEVQVNWNAILTFSAQLTNIRYTGSQKWSREQAEDFLSRLSQTKGGVISWFQSKT
jgi:hypothetical protein